MGRCGVRQADSPAQGRAAQPGNFYSHRYKAPSMTSLLPSGASYVRWSNTRDLRFRE